MHSIKELFLVIIATSLFSGGIIFITYWLIKKAIKDKEWPKHYYDESNQKNDNNSNQKN